MQYDLSISYSHTVDKSIAKSKFYSEGGANTRVERLFIEQIESIYWANKLSSTTMNIESQEDLREVQIFSVNARVEILDIEISVTLIN